MANEIENVMLLQLVVNSFILDFLSKNDKFPPHSELADEDEISYSSYEYFLISMDAPLLEYSDTIKLLESLKNSGVKIN